MIIYMDVLMKASKARLSERTRGLPMMAFDV